MGVQFFKRIMTRSFIDAVKNLGKTKDAGVVLATFDIVVAHPGHSSQLFTVATGRNAFLACQADSPFGQSVDMVAANPDSTGLIQVYFQQ